MYMHFILLVYRPGQGLDIKWLCVSERKNLDLNNFFCGLD